MSAAVQAPRRETRAELRGAGLLGFIAARVFALDVFVGVSLVAIWLTLYGTNDLSRALLLCALLFGLRLFAWLAQLGLALAPLRAWRGACSELDDETLRAAESALAGLPRKMALNLTAGWVGYYVALTALVWWAFPGLIGLEAAELPAAGLQIAAVAFGTPVLLSPLIATMIAEHRAALLVELQRRAEVPQGVQVSLTRRLILVGAILVTGPLLWLSSMTWISKLEATRARALGELAGEVELAIGGGPDAELLWADAFDERDPLELERVSELPASLVVIDEGPRLLALVERETDEVAIAVALDEGGWLLARRSIHPPHARFWVLLTMTLIVVLIWGLSTVTAMTSFFMDPIRRLSASARRLSEVGDLSAMGRLPQVTNDEVGTLTTNVNRVLDDLESLTAGAQAVARGDLSVAIVGAGELPDAFRSMVEQLHEVVLQIRETSIGLATAASEIHAATSEQERAADRQSAGMRSLGQVMDSLASSASQVSGAATGVLENAEGTLTTTDEMSRKIDELNERSKGIGELLELIREIADRSDLLALNGSLEATRAGEAGRGFSLVAAEMRRLAERVTGTVTDVRELVADIKAASGSTVMVTERSRKLAEGTAEAAREIAAETQRQSQDTERATRSVREVGEVIVQIGEAITETRSAAEGLRVQAATLEELIGRFEVRGESHSGSSMRFLGSGVYESGVYGSGVYGSGVYESAAKREGGRS